MTFKGRHEQYRKMAIIEFSTMDQVLLKAKDVMSPDLAIMDFTIGPDGLIQTEVVQSEDKATQSGEPEAEAAPPVPSKISIKVRKEKK